MAQVLKENVRTKIIEAAKEALLNDGRDASMRDIAKRAKLTVGNIYRYFDSKEDIINTIVHHPLTLLNQEIEHASAFRLSLEESVKSFTLTEDDYNAFLSIADRLMDIYEKYPEETVILINDSHCSEEIRIWFASLLSCVLINNPIFEGYSDEVREKFADAASISIFYGLRRCFARENITVARELVFIYFYSFVSLLYMEP